VGLFWCPTDTGGRQLVDLCWPCAESLSKLGFVERRADGTPYSGPERRRMPEPERSNVWGRILGAVRA
jgi:hypothetical protein